MAGLSAVLVTVSSAKAGELREGTIWIDMPSEETVLSETELNNALRVRLPELDVERVMGDVSFEHRCPKNVPDSFLLVLRQPDADHVSIQCVRCSDGETLFTETLDAGGDEDVHRRIAVITGLSLTAGDTARPAATPRTPETTDQKHTQVEALPNRPVATLSMAPGFTAAPAAHAVVFSGAVDVGVLLAHAIWLEIGTTVSTPFRGSADKKPNDDETDILVRVQGFQFRITARYRLQLSSRLFGVGGVSVSYTHFKARDEKDGKFKVEEVSPVSRGAVSPALGLGMTLHRYVSLLLGAGAEFPFGDRRFKIRGEEALRFGVVSIFADLGLLFTF